MFQMIARFQKELEQKLIKILMVIDEIIAIIVHSLLLLSRQQNVSRKL